jgi:hypothetical protein
MLQRFEAPVLSNHYQGIPCLDVLGTGQIVFFLLSGWLLLFMSFGTSLPQAVIALMELVPGDSVSWRLTGSPVQAHDCIDSICIQAS